MEGLRRVDVPEIAREAFREAVINAFCHRDWREYDSVNVAIFADRAAILTYAAGVLKAPFCYKKTAQKFGLRPAAAPPLTTAPRRPAPPAGFQIFQPYSPLSG